MLQLGIHFLRTGERLPEPSLAEQMETVLEHYEAMLAHYDGGHGVRIARKHISWYSRGLPGSGEFRDQANRCPDPVRVRAMILDFYRPLIERRAA